MKKTGLFFGSYNPVHTGHMIIANYLAQYSDMDEVWLVVSPHNPFKKKESLAPDYDRLHLVHLAIGDNPLLKASDIEFKLPKPSYTIDTLIHLREKYPDREFALIMGEDNLISLPRWKNYEQILENHHIYVYNRTVESESELHKHPKVHFIIAPLLHVSASLVRKIFKEGKSIQYLVPDAVYRYLEENPGMYRR